MGCIFKVKFTLIKGVYYVEVSDSDGKRVIWEVVEDDVVNDPREHYHIGLHWHGSIGFVHKEADKKKYLMNFFIC